MTFNEPMTSYRQTAVRFTAAEFMQLAQHPPISDWLGKVELVDGEIVRMAPANIPHWNAQRIAFLRLQSIFADKGPDWIVGQEPTVRLAGETIREPDVAVLFDPDLSGRIFDRAALFLVVEIADSSLALDLGPKLNDYAEAFVPHYWVVDLNARQIHVMRTPRAGNYWEKKVVNFSNPIPVPGTDTFITLD